MSGPTPLRPEPDQSAKEKEKSKAGDWPAAAVFIVFLICATLVVLEKM